MVMRSTTKVIAGAMRVLSVDVQSQDGIPNAALLEAACRLDELQELLEDVLEQGILPVELRQRIEEAVK